MDAVEIGLITLMAALIGLIGYFIHGFRSDLSDLKGDLSDLRGDLSGLRTEIKSELSEVRGEIGEVRGELSEVRGELSEVRGEIGEIKAVQAIHGQMLASISQKQSEHGERIARLEGAADR